MCDSHTLGTSDCAAAQTPQLLPGPQAAEPWPGELDWALSPPTGSSVCLHGTGHTWLPLLSDLNVPPVTLASRSAFSGVGFCVGRRVAGSAWDRVGVHTH